MSKNLGKLIEDIVNDAESTQITIFTSHLKIDGSLYSADGKCKDCNDCLLTLENALICRLEDYCVCNEEGCECNDYVCFRYDWFNVNVSEVVGFSVIRA